MMCSRFDEAGAELDVGDTLRDVDGAGVGIDFSCNGKYARYGRMIDSLNSWDRFLRPLHGKFLESES